MLPSHPDETLRASILHCTTQKPDPASRPLLHTTIVSPRRSPARRTAAVSLAPVARPAPASPSRPRLSIPIARSAAPPRPCSAHLDGPERRSRSHARARSGARTEPRARAAHNARVAPRCAGRGLPDAARSRPPLPRRGGRFGFGFALARVWRWRPGARPAEMRDGARGDACGWMLRGGVGVRVCARWQAVCGTAAHVGLTWGRAGDAACMLSKHSVADAVPRPGVFLRRSPWAARARRRHRFVRPHSISASLTYPGVLHRGDAGQPCAQSFVSFCANPRPAGRPAPCLSHLARPTVPHISRTVDVASSGSGWLPSDFCLGRLARPRLSSRGQSTDGLRLWRPSCSPTVLRELRSGVKIRGNRSAR